jgi:hypothetical protein
VEPSQQVVDGESAKLQCRDKATGEVDKASTEEDRAAKKAVSASEEARRGGGRKKGGVEGKGGGGEEGGSDRSLLPWQPWVSLGSGERREVFEKIFFRSNCHVLYRN